MCVQRGNELVCDSGDQLGGGLALPPSLLGVDGDAVSPRTVPEVRQRQPTRRLGAPETLHSSFSETFPVMRDSSLHWRELCVRANQILSITCF